MATDTIPESPLTGSDMQMVALIAAAAVLVLGAISESLYLIFGHVAYSCATNGNYCDTFFAAFVSTFFDTGKGGDDLIHAYSTFSIGAPGLNNLFLLIFSYIDPENRTTFYATVAISYLVAFLAIFWFLILSRRLALIAQILLAVLFAVGWFALYTGAEVALFGGDFMSVATLRYFEIVVATVTLTAAAIAHRLIRIRDRP